MLYFVYIMTNSTRTVLYTGMTNNIERRVAEHKTHQKKGFTDTYNTTSLIYYETYESPKEAIAREKQIKRWARIKKHNLIDRLNPTWEDLAESW
jgi:putative endonuclease